MRQHGTPSMGMPAHALTDSHGIMSALMLHGLIPGGSAGIGPDGIAHSAPGAVGQVGKTPRSW